jgi:UDP-2,3-diacylglucosamine pyrophosphatase LpxH
MQTVSRQIRCRTVFISDIHLGFKDCKAEYLLDFLDNIQTDTLYLLGDIVDLWSLRKRLYWPSSHYEVLKKFSELASKGTRVVYIPGNHDETCRDYVDSNWSEIEVREEAVHETAQGKKLLLIHGDILDHVIRLDKLNRFIGDSAYGVLLFLNRWCNYLRRRLGFNYWSLASYIKNRVKNARAAIDTYEHAAVKESHRRGLDGVVCGHIHQPEIAQFEEGMYFNDGDWIENCSALVEDHSGNIELLRWTESQTALKSLRASNDSDGGAASSIGSIVNYRPST